LGGLGVRVGRHSGAAGFIELVRMSDRWGFRFGVVKSVQMGASCGLAFGLILVALAGCQSGLNRRDGIVKVLVYAFS
jgi:hypothetical protein